MDYEVISYLYTKCTTHRNHNVKTNKMKENKICKKKPILLVYLLTIVIRGKDMHSNKYK